MLGAQRRHPPDFGRRIEIQQRNQRIKHRGQQEQAHQQNPVPPRIPPRGDLHLLAAQIHHVGVASEQPARQRVGPLRGRTLRANPAAKHRPGQRITHHQQAGRHNPEAENDKKVGKPDLPIQNHNRAVGDIDMKQTGNRNHHQKRQRQYLTEGSRAVKTPDRGRCSGLHPKAFLFCAHFRKIPLLSSGVMPETSASSGDNSRTRRRNLCARAPSPRLAARCSEAFSAPI